MRNLLIIIIVVGAIAAFSFYSKNLSGIWPAIELPKQDISDIITNRKSENKTASPFTLPSGLSVSIYSKALGNVRDLEFDPGGNLLASLTKEGKVVALPDKNKDGISDETVTVVSGLNQPHGIAFRENKIYIAETNVVAVYDYDQTNFKATNKKKIIDLPSGSGHFTRSLLFNGDKLLISIGSSCNVCNEKDSRRASIMISNPDGSDLKTFASGLRNSVFMTKNPVTGDVWATEMGRDLLGDDIPPDEINIIREGNYGWPICYGKNVHDTEFDKNAYIRNPCSDDQAHPSLIDIPAHSAPLGLAFWKGSLLVAFHGSWNRSVPTGYKIVKIDPKTGKIEDFITGWLKGKEALGRPVDILVRDDKTIFVSDDKSGVVYKLDTP